MFGFGNSVVKDRIYTGCIVRIQENIIFTPDPVLSFVFHKYTNITESGNNSFYFVHVAICHSGIVEWLREKL